MSQLYGPGISIGIEMCVRNKGSKADTSRDWYFEDATAQTAIELTKELVTKYNIPADHVIRHYDVTGKLS
jgi:N-acetylmuramoyl-L-alanine amidase CwlA